MKPVRVVGAAAIFVSIAITVVGVHISARADDTYFPPDAHPGVYTHPDGILSAFTGWLNSSGAAERGFLGGVRTGDLDLTLRWKNISAQDRAAALERARRDGLTVSFAAVPFDHSDLKAMEHTLRQLGAEGQFPGYDVMAVADSGSVTAPGSTLPRVMVVPVEAPHGSPRLARPALTQRLERELQTRIILEERDQPIPA